MAIYDPFVSIPMNIMALPVSSFGYLFRCGGMRIIKTESESPLYC